MFDFVPQLTFVGLVVGVVWYLLRPRPAFVIRIRGGVAKVVRGKTTASILNAVADVCGQSGVTSGTIRGLTHGKRIRLECSSNISTGCQQQLRNMLLAEL